MSSGDLPSANTATEAWRRVCAARNGVSNKQLAQVFDYGNVLESTPSVFEFYCMCHGESGRRGRAGIDSLKRVRDFRRHVTKEEHKHITLLLGVDKSCDFENCSLWHFCVLFQRLFQMAKVHIIQHR